MATQRGSSTRLEMPAQKHFIEDLGAKVQPSQVVWIQGHVTDVSAADGACSVSDGSGTVVLTGLSKIPGADASSLSKGKYVQVIGELRSAGSPAHVLAMKIQDLSSQQYAAQMWPLEVHDYHKYVMPHLQDAQ